MNCSATTMSRPTTPSRHLGTSLPSSQTHILSSIQAKQDDIMKTLKKVCEDIRDIKEELKKMKDETFAIRGTDIQVNNF